MREDELISQIIRSSRRTLSLEIGSDGNLIIRAPLRLSIDRINQAVAQKRSWIIAKQQKAKERVPQAAKTQFVEGEEFLYLGVPYKLRMVEDSKKLFEFNGEEFLIAQRTIKHAKYHFVRWYIRQAKEYIGPRVHFFAKMAGQEYAQVSITSAKTRWGSCTSKRTLNFSWRLMMAPLDKIDYVVAHEVAHLEQLNHSKKFWKKVQALMPDYKIRQQWFKDNQHRVSF